MRSRSLARVVMASLGICVVFTLGCGITEPTPRPEPFSVLSISPSEGLTSGTTTASIAGIGFRPGATVTIDGIRVDARVLSATAISVAMPPHAAGKVDVTVGQYSQAPASVPGGYTYVFSPPPVITEVLPHIGSTGGGTLMTIRGTGFHSGLTVTVGGIKHSNFYYLDSTNAQIFTQAHAAGMVEVIVTNRDGQAASSQFTYASPATFNVNGDWQGVVTDWDGVVSGPFVMIIRDNIVVSASCRGSSLTLDPPPVVANGQIRFVGSDGGRLDGAIVSPNSAFGTINLSSCVAYPYWSAEKK